MNFLSELKKVFQALAHHLTAEQKENFLSYYYFDLKRFKKTLGKYLTENHLKPNDPLFKEYTNAGILVVDDMLMLTIVLYYMHLSLLFPDREHYYTLGH